MTREELEHIIRASADVTDQYEFMIVGSQSILGPVPNPEEVFTMSAEADIYPLQAPELADINTPQFRCSTDEATSQLRSW